ncbi:hypothetical protein OG244_23305 [Streptomyces brevispora]|uniref:hypothetical protein n=1 Tax=Streptomyces brevispora TaxID=887462 RepID=UPI002E35D1AC|nr:hypothetical protein [Streptomyces brevispora]
MSVNPSESYTALYDPEKDALFYAPSLSEALHRARKTLDEKAAANIHDRDAMIRAAVGLEMCLRQLVDALDKEAGR